MARLQQTLTTAQLVTAVERMEGVRLPLSTVSRWAEQGMLIPSVTWARRHRVERVYDLTDLARARIVARLRRAGFSLSRVRAVLNCVERDLPPLLRLRVPAILHADRYRAWLALPGRETEVPTGQIRLKLESVYVTAPQLARALRAA